MCCLLAAHALGQERPNRAKRLYVETFASKTGGKGSRGFGVADLRGSGSVSLVSDEADAEFILGDGGEVWLKEYRSFSPRSHMKLSTNGIPVYGGYQSVELRNKSGATVWSYLETPGTDSEDIWKSLARRIARRAAEALNRPDRLTVSLPPAPAAVALRGAGAYPIASFTWFVVPAHASDEAKRAAITAFLSWMLGPGQRQAAALGYLALPKEIVSREEAAITRIQ